MYEVIKRKRMKEIKEDWILAGNKWGKTVTVYHLVRKAIRNARRRELYKKKKEEKECLDFLKASG
jgi:hypothetical protein